MVGLRWAWQRARTKNVEATRVMPSSRPGLSLGCPLIRVRPWDTDLGARGRSGGLLRGTVVGGGHRHHLLLPILILKASRLAGVITTVAIRGRLLMLPCGGSVEGSSSRDLGSVVKTHLVERKH